MLKMNPIFQICSINESPIMLKMNPLARNSDVSNYNIGCNVSGLFLKIGSAVAKW